MDTMASTNTFSFLGRGIYDVVDVARLTHRDPATIVSWTSARQGATPLVDPEVPGAYSFVDLISLHVISVLVRRGVSKKDIARGGQFLVGQLQSNRPFAHRALATVGRSFFADLDPWVDVGLSGQTAFDEVIQPLLRPIEYDDNEMAAIWRPHHRVWLNPHIQAGAPCVEGSRIPTSTVAALVANGDHASDVADDYRISVDEVEAAVRWEESLRAA